MGKSGPRGTVRVAVKSGPRDRTDRLRANSPPGTIAARWWGPVNIDHVAAVARLGDVGDPCLHLRPHHICTKACQAQFTAVDYGREDPAGDQLTAR